MWRMKDGYWSRVSVKRSYLHDGQWDTATQKTMFVSVGNGSDVNVWWLRTSLHNFENGEVHIAPNASAVGHRVRFQAAAGGGLKCLCMGGVFLNKSSSYGGGEGYWNVCAWFMKNVTAIWRKRRRKNDVNTILCKIKRTFCSVSNKCSEFAWCWNT
jgi:hypothetical protein